MARRTDSFTVSVCGRRLTSSETRPRTNVPLPPSMLQVQKAVLTRRNNVAIGQFLNGLLRDRFHLLG